MTGWSIFAIWVAGWIVSARVIAHATISSDQSSDAEDKIMARVLGVLTGIIWPLVLLGAVMTGRLPKTDRQLRQELRDREATVKARDRRIAELERELGIGPREGG